MVGHAVRIFGASYATPEFDPTRVAGTLQFTPSTLETARLQYVVDGAAVAKDVARQTLRLANYSGTYPVTAQRVTSHCPDPPANGDRVAQETVAVAPDGNVVAIDGSTGQRTCRYTGSYFQSGRGAAQKSYTCSDGESGDLTSFELTKHDGFIAGRFQGHGLSNGCDYRGRFSGFVPD